MQRRTWLKAAAALAAAGIPLFRALPAFGMGSAPDGGWRMADGGRRTPQPFDYAWLKGQARALAGAEYQAPGKPHPELAKLDWDSYQAIRYRDAQQLWAGGESRFRVAFFHLGLFFTAPVRLHEVADGMAREIAYDPAMFDYGKSGLDSRKLPRDLGFSGFRVLYHTDPKRDVAAFLGASYFRAVSGEMQYGLSARGLAIDCGMARPEEFPSFTAFWLEQPAPGSGKLTVYALLDSPSIAGAYRFDIAPGAVLVMDVDAALYPRREIERLGIAPLTSMFAYGENDRRARVDWRPEIHDSDGLAMWTGTGEWIWRPLVNPPGVRFNSHADNNPRGFGLLQRDRNFENYQDDGAFYERRPSLWVEPKSPWGKGQVQLLEFATEGETDDNIAAFWNPAEKPRPGTELLYSYRLHWGGKPPVLPPLAQAVATRTGVGGVVGKVRNHFSWRFVVDFAGTNFAMLHPKADVEPAISASRGEIEITSARPLKSIGGYRAMFDLRPTDNSTEPINLRMYLRAGGAPLTETWMYQWSPPAAAERQRLVSGRAD